MSGKDRCRGGEGPVIHHSMNNVKSVQGLICNRDQPVGPLITSVDSVPLWQEPGIAGRIPVIGPLFNVLYNFSQQKLTFNSVGEFLSDNLGPGGDLSQKRVGLLEDTSAGGAGQQ